MKNDDKQTEKPNLLELFNIINTPSTSTFQLFCRFLTQDDVYEYKYFEESQVENYDLPNIDQLDEGYFDNTDLLYRLTESGNLVEGLLFGTYSTYGDAVTAALSYSADSLLEKYYDVYEESKYKLLDI